MHFSTLNRERHQWLWQVAVFWGGAIMPAFAAVAETGAPTVRIFEWQPFLAPFHAVVLHLPIGFLTVSFILELHRFFRPKEELRQINTLILALSLATGIITAAFGLMRAGTGGYDQHAIDLHRAYGLAVLACTLVALVLQRLAYRDQAGRGWICAYRGQLGITLALLVVAGHLGGNLTHGEKYLVENAPDFVRTLLEDDVPPNSKATEALDEKQRFYRERVQPVFAAKCYNCHGPDKQKGGYRLDLSDRALKGGESGKAGIKPFDPMESYLVRLILLPSDHDDVMPPSGKKPLSIEEIAAILEWIRNGALFPSAATSAAVPARRLS